MQTYNIINTYGLYIDHRWRFHCDVPNQYSGTHKIIGT